MSIKDIASAKLPEMINNRRHMHMHPELSFKEKETYKFIFQNILIYIFVKMSGQTKKMKVLVSSLPSVKATHISQFVPTLMLYQLKTRKK